MTRCASIGRPPCEPSTVIFEFCSVPKKNFVNALGAKQIKLFRADCIGALTNGGGDRKSRCKRQLNKTRVKASSRARH